MFFAFHCYHIVVTLCTRTFCFGGVQQQILKVVTTSFVTSFNSILTYFYMGVTRYQAMGPGVLEVFFFSFFGMFRLFIIVLVTSCQCVVFVMVCRNLVVLYDLGK